MSPHLLTPSPEMDTLRLQKRNVEVFDSGGAVIAGNILSTITFVCTFFTLELQNSNLVTNCLAGDPIRVGLVATLQIPVLAIPPIPIPLPMSANCSNPFFTNGEFGS